jgi:hypothetical protein
MPVVSMVPVMSVVSVVSMVPVMSMVSLYRRHFNYIRFGNLYSTSRFGSRNVRCKQDGGKRYGNKCSDDGGQDLFHN